MSLDQLANTWSSTPPDVLDRDRKFTMSGALILETETTMKHEPQSDNFYTIQTLQNSLPTVQESQPTIVPDSEDERNEGSANEDSSSLTDPKFRLTPMLHRYGYLAPRLIIPLH